MWDCHGDRHWVWQLGLVSCAACSNRLKASFGLVSLARNSRSFSSLISLQYLAVPLQIPRWGHAVPLVKPIQISTHPACRSPFYNQYTKDGDEPQHWIYTVCEHCLQLLWEKLLSFRVRQQNCGDQCHLQTVWLLCHLGEIRCFGHGCDKLEFCWRWFTLKKQESIFKSDWKLDQKILRAVFELCKSDNSFLDHVFWNFLVLLGLLTVDSAVFDLYFF